MHIARAAIVSVAIFLTGCASGYRVDSDVRAFSQLSARPADARYRFERLPSQQNDAAGQAQLEAVAEPALARAGLRRDDGAALYAVQVTARAQRVAADPFDHWGPWGGFGGFGRFGGLGGFGGGRGYAVTSTGHVVWLSPWPHGRGLSGWGGLPPPSLVQREVALTLRELASGRIVYETHAVHDGVPRDEATTLAAMFDAALRDFPQPASGRLRVDVPPPAPAPAPIPAPVPLPAATPAPR